MVCIIRGISVRCVIRDDIILVLIGLENKMRRENKPVVVIDHKDPRVGGDCVDGYTVTGGTIPDGDVVVDNGDGIFVPRLVAEGERKS